MLICGIDPGLSGALALVRGPVLLACVDMPIEAKGGSARVKNRVACAQLAVWLRQIRAAHDDDIVAVVEAVQSGAGQGVASVYSLGDSAGALRGALQALNFRIEFVTPAAWKRAMKVPADKGVARRLAMERFPSEADLFARVKDDGRAESALIAAYGWETFA